MLIRNAIESDYVNVISVLNEWWGGRQMTDMLPHLFFKYFTETCYILEEEEKMIGFLVGFISQTYPDQAYIHFFGTAPTCRRKGYGRTAYEHFFDMARQKGCRSVHAVTSIVNKASIAFHTGIGFQIDEGDTRIDGISVHTDYDGPRGGIVLFSKEI